MLEVLVIMGLGMLIGFLFRSRKKFISAINKSTIWIISALLFFMGVSVGIDNNIMGQLSIIGLQGFILALVAILGSVLLSWVVYVLYFKNVKH